MATQSTTDVDSLIADLGIDINKAAAAPQQPQDIDALMSNLGITAELTAAAAAAPPPPAPSSPAPPVPRPAPQPVTLPIVTSSDVDSLITNLGIKSTSTSTTTSTTSTSPPPPIKCAGPGAMRCAGPGAMRCAGPGAMKPAAVMCAGPGAMRGMSAGPGALLSAGPGAKIQPAVAAPDGSKVVFHGPTCVGCNEMIIGKVITASGKNFHPDCFQCHECKHKILEGAPFMEEKEQFYCEHCFYELFADRCFNCKAPIIDQCVKFQDRTYHPNHFVCASCGDGLIRAEYKEDEGEPYCLKCKQIRVKMRETKNELCAKCKKPIMGDYILLNGQKIHPEHYRCAACGCEFSGGNSREFDGKSYCLECYDKLNRSVCHRCGKPIIGRAITAMLRSFHPECLTCTECGASFANGGFYEKDGAAYCKFHFYKLFGNRCPRCQEPVEDDGISALGSFWHPKCWTCNGCSKALGNKVYNYEDKPLCKGCFSKLPRDVRNAIEEKMEANAKLAKQQKKQEEAEAKAAAKASKAAAAAATTAAVKK